jgi:hypothetical protein
VDTFNDGLFDSGRRRGRRGIAEKGSGCERKESVSFVPQYLMLVVRSGDANVGGR